MSVVDNGFDLNLHVNNCGACGRACSVAGGIPGCMAGACTILACNPGHYDCDGNPANGCERTAPCTTAEPFVQR